MMYMAVCDTLWVLSTYRMYLLHIVFNITFVNISIYIYIH